MGFMIGKSSRVGQRHAQKRRVQLGPYRQTERHIGNAQNGFQAQLFFHGTHRPQSVPHILLLGAGSQGQAVDVHILPGDARLQRRVQNVAGHLHPVLRFGGDAAVVQGQAHHRRAVLFAQGQHRRQHRGLGVHRVHDGLAVVNPQARFQHLGAGGVQLQGQLGHALNGGHRTAHHLRLVDLGQAHIHVQNLGARLGLFHRLAQQIVHIPGPQGFLHLLFAGGVDALTDHGAGAHFTACMAEQTRLSGW